MRFPHLPHEPGCYLFKSKGGAILYIGKALSLRKRVNSYFDRPPDSEKTAALVAQVHDVEFVATDTESEALLLENRLIKAHNPPYNIDLKGGERYAYIQITSDAFPRLVTARQPQPGGKYFGPYTDGTARRQALELAQRMFGLRTCRRMPKRVCLQYHIKRCSGPCQGHIGKAEYLANVKRAEQLLRGHTEELRAQLQQDMLAASAAQRFELARERRDQIAALEHIGERQKVERQVKYDQDVIAIAAGESKAVINVLTLKRGILRGSKPFIFDLRDGLLDEFVPRYYFNAQIPAEIICDPLESPEAVHEFLQKLSATPVKLTTRPSGPKRGLLEMARKNALLNLEGGAAALADLKEKLKLPEPPQTIEGFDISHLGGTQTVASMVQFARGAPNKAEYRHFNIRTAANNDTQAIREVVDRRYRRLTREGAAMPHLILIDGGAPQVNAAYQALSAQGLSIPLVGLAKKEEALYFPNFRFPVRLDRRSEALKLLQRVRDEAHRFANTLQKKRRKMDSSALDGIPGVGPATKRKLLKVFGSMENLRKAPQSELEKHLPAKAAQKLKAAISG